MNPFRTYIYNPIQRLKLKRFGSYILDNSQNASSILDVGCGNMQLTNYINNNTEKTRVEGIDVIDYRHSKEMPLTLYDGENIPFKDKEFDISYAVLVLHHCKDEVKVLKEMIRVSQKRVILIEEVYNNTLEKIWTSAQDWFMNMIQTFNMSISLKFHTVEEWEEIINKLDAHIIDIKKITKPPYVTRQRLIVIEVS